MLKHQHFLKSLLQKYKYVIQCFCYILFEKQKIQFYSQNSWQKSIFIYILPKYMLDGLYGFFEHLYLNLL